MSYRDKVLRHHVGRTQVWEKDYSRVLLVVQRGVQLQPQSCGEETSVLPWYPMKNEFIYSDEIHRNRDSSGNHTASSMTHKIRQLTRIQWTEYQEKRRVRCQVLCYALNEPFTAHDAFLNGELGVDAAMQRLIPADGLGIYLAPIAIRSPSAHS